MDTTLFAFIVALIGMVLLVAGVRLATRLSLVADAIGPRAGLRLPGRRTAHRHAHPHLRASVPRQSGIASV
jgi:hypothetical protein